MAELIIVVSVALGGGCIAIGAVRFIVERDFWLLRQTSLSRLGVKAAWILVLSSAATAWYLTTVTSAVGRRHDFPALSINWTPGVVSDVVWFVLGMMAVYALGFGFERAFEFRRARRESLELAGDLPSVLRARRLEDALELVRSERYRHSHLARVIEAGLLEAIAARRDRRAASSSMAPEYHRAVSTIAGMSNGLSLLSSIATTAPFVGLFGTVVGVIAAFTDMAPGATIWPAVAEALLTTAGGLLVAIPAVWSYFYLRDRLNRAEIEMANAESELKAILQEQARPIGVRPGA